MRWIAFTEEEIKQLAHESIHYPHHIVRRRMEALLLKSQGMSHKDIATRLDISGTTLRTYFDLFIAGRVEALKQLHHRGKRNLLQERKDEIIACLEQAPPATLKEAQAKIEVATGLKRSLSQVSAFLKKQNFASEGEANPGQSGRGRAGKPSKQRPWSRSLSKRKRANSICSSLTRRISFCCPSWAICIP